MARSATAPATRTGLKWPLDQCASLGWKTRGAIFCVATISEAAPPTLRTKRPPMLLASVVTGEMELSPPCFDFHPLESS